MTLQTSVSEAEQQRLYAGRFYRQVGKLPVGEVRMAMRMESRRYFLSGLEGQVKERGADGKDFLRTVFTPIRRYIRDGNKYRPANNQEKYHVEEPQGEGDTGASPPHAGAGNTSGGVPQVPDDVDVQPQAAQAGGRGVGEV